MILYRCKKVVNGTQCDARNALTKPIEKYTRKPRCKSCGHPLSGYVDRWQKRKNREATCICDGLSYPHLAGSSVWCVQHPHGPSDADHTQRSQTR